MAKVKFKIEGMKELKKSLDKLGKVPQKHVTSAARKGMNIPLKHAKADAPEDTGNLKRGIKLAGERSKFKGKKVYRIIFDPAMNDIFQKKDAEGKIVAYYPVSQEYGFHTKNGRYIPGYRFVRDSLANNTKLIEKTIVGTMKTKIDQEIRKARLR